MDLAKLDPTHPSCILLWILERRLGKASPCKKKQNSPSSNPWTHLLGNKNFNTHIQTHQTNPNRVNFHLNSPSFNNLGLISWSHLWVCYAFDPSLKGEMPTRVRLTVSSTPYKFRGICSSLLIQSQEEEEEEEFSKCLIFSFKCLIFSLLLFYRGKCLRVVHALLAASVEVDAAAMAATGNYH